jgi:hypothetical protein
MGNTFTKHLAATLLSGVLVTSAVFGQATGAFLSAGSAFLKGNYVEVGISPCGAYGTPTLPPGLAGGNTFHPSPALPGLGFVADHQRNGWTTGTPNYCGDYFVPGSPVEGFSMRANGIDYLNTDGVYCSFPSIPATSLNVFSTVDSVRSVWVGTVAGQFTVTQTTRFHKDSLFFVTDVMICNISAAPLTGVYYGRNVDPDNEQPWTGDFTTSNVVVAQPAGVITDALVTATGLIHGCFLGLGSKDSRARVTHGGFSTVSPINYYNVTPGYMQTVGTTTVADEAISIGFSLGDIPAGQCVCLSFAYILNSAQMGAALNATTGVGVMAGGVDISSSLTAPICPPATSTTLSITGGGGYTWTWSPAAGLSSTSGTTVVASPATTTTYTATGTRPGNCGLITRSITVLRDNSTIDAGPPQTMCNPDTIAMNATYAGFPLGGITCTPNYLVSSVPFAMEPIGAAVAAWDGVSTFAYDDWLYGPFALPFTFNFFCNDFTSIYASSNGFASFNAAAGSGCCSGQVLPTTWEPNNVIAAGWEDLYPPGGGIIRYWTNGVAPNRRFVIRWFGIPHFSGTSPYFDCDMEVVLYETSNVIQINYVSMPSDGGSHTSGIENGAGTIGFWPAGWNATSWTATNQSFRFTPNPIISGGYSWTPGSTLSTPLLEDPMAWPTSTTMYYVTVNNGYCTLTDSVLITVSCVLDASDLQLTGSKDGNASLLNWNVSENLHASTFYVERSQDGQTYTQVGSVKSTGATSYDLHDLLPLAGDNYYRIRVIDIFGEEAFSNVVLVQFGEDEINSLRAVYPNPSTGIFNFDISLVEKSDISLSVFNHFGQRVKAEDFSYDQAGRFTNLLDMSDMANGVYFYELSIGGRQYQGKLSVLK